jgi:hydrogenase nickel incorporation protein HypA/HybF
MHELAISRAILEQAIGHAEGRRVTRVSLTVGALRQVAPESLRFYFEIVSRGTLCEGAELEPRAVAARLRCRCGAEWELAELAFRCPACADADVTVLDGDQLRVESIEVEEEQCIAPR